MQRLSNFVEMHRFEKIRLNIAGCVTARQLNVKGKPKELHFALGVIQSMGV